MGKYKDVLESIFNKTFVVSVVVSIIVFVLVSFYLIKLSPVIVEKDTSFYLKENISKAEFFDKLKSDSIVNNTFVMKMLLGNSRNKCAMNSGHYIVKKGMTNLEISNMFKYGLQSPVRITFNNIRSIKQLSGILSRQLMLDSLKINKALNDSAIYEKLKITKEELPFVFIPDSYEVWWNISAKNLTYFFISKNKSFWNQKRLDKAKNIGLTPQQVSTLASIIEEETNKAVEMPIIAGLYINRLRRGMKLQSDPTVKFAAGDMSIKRILTVHLSTDSPYNTYMYAGLPPGPIRIPSKTAINAVLNYKENKYLYMCAKSDFSGYHVFAKNLREHNNNAIKYHNALNKLRIYK